MAVCTANQCRSPMAEALARRIAERDGLPIVASSAGTDAADGIPATVGAVRAMRRLGLDLDSHLSRNVKTVDVGGIDLVVCMERRHVLDLVNDHGWPLTSTFTLGELARIVATTPAEPDEGLQDWLGRVAVDRSPAHVLTAPEVADPIGRSMRHYRRTASQIDDLLVEILAGLPR